MQDASRTSPASDERVASPTHERWDEPKDHRLVPYGTTNLGTPPDALGDDLVTPTERFFVRANYRIPDVDPATWTLTVRGQVDRPLTLTLDDLLALPRRRVLVFMECSGNSRERWEPATPGTPWRDDAVGNAAWTGTPLSHLLELAGLRDGVVDVVSQGADDEVMQRGLPVRAALDPDTLVATHMNDEPLLAAHGAPARLVVPGWGGIASTKWLVDLEAVDHRFEGHWNSTEYVLLDADGHETGRVEEMPVKSIVVSPRPGATVLAGRVELQGFAWSGHGEVARVEVSTDDGATYVPVSALERVGPRAWTRWTHTVDALPGDLTVRVRAVDVAGNVQPDVARWNAKGYQMNAVVEVHLTVAAT